jgi:invasion protein IalB
MQPIRLRLVLAALGLAVAMPLAAQDAPAADAPAEPPATEAPAAAAPAAEDPADQAPAAEEPAGQAPAAGPVGQAPGAAAGPGRLAVGPCDELPAGDPATQEIGECVRDTFGDWEVRCAPDLKECLMYQLARDQQGNPVAEVSIQKLPEVAEADAGVTVVTPLGTLLTAGVMLQIDAGERRQYPFAWCSQIGCFARFGLAKPSVDGMKRGKAGTIMLVSVGAPQTPVSLALSLSGFTAAYDSLEAPVVPDAPAQAPAKAPELPSFAPRN